MLILLVWGTTLGEPTAYSKTLQNSKLKQKIRYLKGRPGGAQTKVGKILLQLNYFYQGHQQPPKLIIQWKLWLLKNSQNSTCNQYLLSTYHMPGPSVPWNLTIVSLGLLLLIMLFFEHWSLFSPSTYSKHFKFPHDSESSSYKLYQDNFT